MQSRGGFSILPPVIKNLLIINSLVFVATALRPGLIEYLGLHFPGTEYFRPFQFLTFMFTHGGFFHFLFNMFSLWMFGNQVENIWGPKKFLAFYLITGFASAVAHYGVVAWEVTSQGYSLTDPGVLRALADTNLVGASGAIYGILVAFAFLFPRQRLMLLFPPIPIEARWLVLGLIGLDLFQGLSGAGTNVAHFAHVGGALVGALFLYVWKRTGKLYDGWDNKRY